MFPSNVQWPTWQDGKPVMVGERAISLRGPMTITSVEIGDGWYRLYSSVKKEDLIDDEIYADLYKNSGDIINYVIDEGKFDSHPYREGEDCYFWPNDEEWVKVGK